MMSSGQKSYLGDESAPLVGGSVTFLRGAREVRDKYWGVAFLVFFVTTLVGGICAIALRNPAALDAIASPEYLQDPRNCPHPNWNLSDNRRRATDDASEEAMLDMAKLSMWIMFGSIFVSALLGLATLWLNRAHPRAMVYSTVIFNAVVMSVAGGSMVKVFPFGGIMFLISAFCLLALAFWYRESLDLCASLMKVAGEGIGANMSLLGVAFVMECFNLVALLPIFAFVVFAAMNGSVVPQEHVRYDPGRQMCFSTDPQMHGVPMTCCEYQPAAWACAYIAIAMFTVLWLLMLMGQVRLFTVSGTIAQWYFSPNSYESGTSRAYTSFRHAIGPQFGSLSEASLILTVVQMVRQEAQNQQQEGGAGAFIMACLANCIGAMVEKLTKFTTIVMSISGQSFMDSAATTYDLLTRNMLSTVTVWWMPNMVLGTFLLIVSLVVSISTGSAAYAHWAAAPQTADLAVGFAFVLGFFVWLLMVAVLGFFTGILLNIIDTVFICFAMDSDKHTATRPDVHEVYAKVPGVAKAIEAGCWTPTQAYSRPPQ